MGNDYEIDENGNKRYILKNTIDDNPYGEENKDNMNETYPKEKHISPDFYQNDAYVGPLDNDPLPCKERVRSITSYNLRSTSNNFKFPEQVYPSDEGSNDVLPEEAAGYFVKMPKKEELKPFPRDSIRKGTVESKSGRPEDNLMRTIEGKDKPKITVKKNPVELTHIVNIPMLRTQKKIKELDDEEQMKAENDNLLEEANRKAQFEDVYRISNLPSNIYNIKKGKYLFPGSEEVLLKSLPQRKKENLQWELVNEWEKSNIVSVKGITDNDEEEGYENLEIDGFCKSVLEKINTIRENPQSYIENIYNAKERITTNRDKSKTIYRGVEGKIKVQLNKGEEAFDETIKELEEMEPMEPLKFSKEITVDQPIKEEEKEDPHYLQKEVEKLIEDGQPIKAYWKDICGDPEICVLLLLVDDNAQQLTGRKRKILLNPDIKYMGISSNYDTDYGSIDKNKKKIQFSSFMTFSKEKKNTEF